MTVKVAPWKDKPDVYLVTVRFKWPDGDVVRDRKVTDFKSAAAARKWGEARESELRAAGKPKPEEVAKPAISFKDFVDKRWWPVYPAKKGNAHTTIKEKRSHLDTHLLPAFGEKPLTVATFGREQLDAFGAALSKKTVGKNKKKPIRGKTINNILATLDVILKSAVEWGVLASVPKMPRVKVDEPPWDFYVRAESDLLIGKARTPEERALLMFAFRTGARAGEQIAFRWEDIDVHNKQIIFRRSSTYGVTVERTKGKKIRRVPMGAALEAALREIKHLRGPLVFCNEDGSELSINQLHERLWGASRRAGLRRIKWHETRHSFASQLVIAGTPLRQVQEWCGHSTIQMTMRYAHLAPGGGREFMDALDGPTALPARASSA